MPNEIDKIIEERFQQMPGDIKVAIVSNTFDQKIKTLADKYFISDDHLNMLQNETLLLMLGMVNLDDYTANISESLQFDPKKANEMAEDVGVIFIEPIQESLLKVFEQDQKDEAAEVIPLSNTLEKKSVSQSAETLSRASVLEEIESPKPTRFKTEEVKIPLPTVVPPSIKENLPSFVSTKPAVTSALAKEIGSILNGEKIYEKPEDGKSEAPPVKGATTQLEPKPEDKLSQIVQVPRKTIEVKAGEIEKPTIDPYREPVE